MTVKGQDNVLGKRSTTIPNGSGSLLRCRRASSFSPSPAMPSRIPRRPQGNVITLALAALLLGACAQTPERPVSPAAVAPAEGEAPVAAARSAPLPGLELTDQILYEFLLAEIAGQRGNPALAAQAYADLARRTRDPRIARRATEVSRAARQPAAAVESARIWLETDPESAEALRTLTGLLVSTNRVDEAQPYLQKILAAEGTARGDGFMQLNRLLANNPDKAANLKLIQDLARPYPQLPEARFAVAQAAATAGDEALALKEIRSALALKPDWEVGALFEAQLLQQQSAEKAAAYLGEYVKRYPQARDARLAYARALVGERRYEEARGQFQSLQKDFPDNQDVLFAVAVLSMQLEDWAGAEGTLKRLMSLDFRDPNTLRLYLGQATEEQKKYPEALQWYGEVTRGEHFMNAQVRVAQVMAKQGDLPGARDFLHKVGATTNQQRVQLILAEAQILRDANQTREALDVVERGLEKLPDHPDLLYDQGMLAEKLGRIDVLESSMRRVMKLRPDHAHAYNALGYTLADRNERLPEARELIEQALKLAPDDAYIMDSMGWVLFRQGRNDEALKWLKRAYALRPDAEIAAHLGEVLWATGNRAEAQRIWKEAVGRTPSNETLIKTIERFRQ
jgi:tetratricopeptide (TPR) repeat protein